MSAPIVWGREIPVDGVRPAWLADDVEVQWFMPHLRPNWETGSQSVPASIAFSGEGLATIKLPADHFAYKALDAGFEPWGGGFAAPADWDGGAVLLCVVAEGAREPRGMTWAVSLDGSFFEWDNANRPHNHVIGYHKRAAPAEQPAKTVTIERMTEGDAGAAYWQHYSPLGQRDGWLAAYRHLGIIREETDLERFERETGVEINDFNRAAIERALGWSASR